MHSIKAKIILTTCAVSITIILALIVLASWLLKGGMQDQAEMVAQKMKTRIDEELTGYRELFFLRKGDSLESVRRATTTIALAENVPQNIERQQLPHLKNYLKKAAPAHGLDFFIAVDVAGKYQASSPVMDEAVFSQFIKEEPLGKSFMQFVCPPKSDNSAAPAQWSTIAVLPSNLLGAMGFEGHNLQGKGTLALIDAELIHDDFGGVVGACIGGILLNLHPEIIQQCANTTQASYSIFLGQIPVVYAFPGKSDKNRNKDNSAYSLPAEIYHKVLASGNVEKADIDWAGNRYMAECSPLVSPSGEMVGISLVAIPAEKVETMQGSIIDFGEETRGRLQNLMIAVGLIGVLILTLAIMLTAEKIVKPIRYAVNFADTVAAGDLTQRMQIKQNDETGKLGCALDKMAETLEIKAVLANSIAAGDLSVALDLASDKDSLGMALQSMVGHLNILIAQIKESSSQVKSGTKQIAVSSQSLSHDATVQAENIQEITSRINQINKQSELNAQSATETNRLATHAQKLAENGNIHMQQMVSAMHELNEASQHISKIVNMIDDVAFQTNLLALNAAVEAARAGRHGKGFAVVAEEVRNLAGRSSRASKETSDMIQNSIEKVNSGMGLAGKSADALKEIVSSITKVTELIDQITEASDRQVMDIKQISNGLHQIDNITQKNASNAEETAVAAEELFSQTEILEEQLAHFRLGDAPASEMHPNDTGLLPSPMEPDRLQVANGMDAEIPAYN